MHFIELSLCYRFTALRSIHQKKRKKIDYRL